MESADGEGSILLKYIRQIIKKWTALQLAIEHGMGGPYAREKEVWFGVETEKFLLNNDGLEYYEVEDFITDILDAEFDTVCQDGSLAEVAQKFCNAANLYRAGSFDELRRLIPRTAPSHVMLSVAASEEQQIEPDSVVTPLNASFQHLQMEENESKPVESEDLPDEWTVVSRGRRKK